MCIRDRDYYIELGSREVRDAYRNSFLERVFRESISSGGYRGIRTTIRKMRNALAHNSINFVGNPEIDGILFQDKGFALEISVKDLHGLVYSLLELFTFAHEIRLREDLKKTYDKYHEITIDSRRLIFSLDRYSYPGNGSDIKNLIEKVKKYNKLTINEIAKLCTILGCKPQDIVNITKKQ